MHTLSALLASTSFLACLDRAVAPNTPIVQAKETRIQEERQLVRGTATLVIESDGNSAPKVTIMQRDTSNSIAIVEAAPAEYDANARLLTINLAIRNKSRLRLTEPAALGVANLGRPLGNLAPNPSGDLEVADQRDTVRVFDAGAVVHAWEIARLTSHPDNIWRGEAGLRPDSLSQTKQLSFRLPGGISKFEIPVVARATLRLQTPAQYPSGTPDSILIQLNDTSNTSKYPGSTSLALREWFWLGFEPSLSQIERQAIIDKIDGLVVGGMDLGSLYLIQVSPGTSLEELLKKVRLVDQLPGVREAALYIYLDPPTTSYRKPSDSSAYSQWSVKPNLANGLNWAAEAISAPFAWGCGRCALPDTRVNEIIGRATRPCPVCPCIPLGDCESQAGA